MNSVRDGKYEETNRVFGARRFGSYRVSMNDVYIGRSLTITLLVFMTIFISHELSAQTGTISGEVNDADTGESLPGAAIILQGTTIGTSADIDGRYTLRRVPAGEHILIISYMGFVTQEIPVLVSEGERLEQNVALTGDFIEGDEVLVVGIQRGQARALTRQRESVNIRSVVSAEQMDAFGDQTVSESLSRIAGMGHGSGNIRGVGAGASNITMDGQRMGSTSGDRSVDLGTISSDMVQDLEVIKVITPDMNADALSGVININTRRPVGAERTVNARLGGGWNTRFGDLTGAGSRASFSFGDSHSDQLSYALNFSYQREPRASESVSTSWDIRNFGEGPKDVLSHKTSGLQFDPRERYGTALQFTFQPTPRSTYHVQGMFNYQTREQVNYGFRTDPSVSRYINPNLTDRRGFGTTSGSFRYNTSLNEYDIHQYTVQAGGRHLFDRFDVEYKLGWGHGRSARDSYSFNFATERNYDFRTDFDDRWNPTMEIPAHSNWRTFPEPNRFFIGSVDNRLFYHIDNEITATVDFEIPYRRVTFRLGSSAILTFKSGEEERLNMSTDRGLTLENFDVALDAGWRVFGREHQTYHIPWLIDLPKATEWFHGRFPLFSMDLETWALGSEIGDFAAHEHVFATYGMGSMDIGRFRFLGGLRVEHTEAGYDGRDASIDTEGRFRGAVDANSVNSYLYLFPNAQLVYALGHRSNIRLAYSRSIGRPTFSQLSPSTLRNHSSETLSHGNPKLNPMLSNNLDLLFEHYFMNVGQFTVGVYYKELSDFVFAFTEIITPDREIITPDGRDVGDEYIGWRWTTYRNGEEATVYGLEVSWQQNLEFLPGFLGNLGTYANYSYSQSVAEMDRPGTTRLRDQRPHVVNVGLDYSQGAFSGQLSYHWAAPSISSYNDLRWVPGIQVRERVYFDSYRDAANDMSLTLRYRLTSSFRLWADFTNMLNHRSISYNYNRDFYPSTASLTGRTVNTGIRYSF